MVSSPAPPSPCLASVAEQLVVAIADIRSRRHVNDVGTIVRPRRIVPAPPPGRRDAATADELVITVSPRNSSKRAAVEIVAIRAAEQLVVPELP
jgi:hypothetical protein